MRSTIVLVIVTLATSTLLESHGAALQRAGRPDLETRVRITAQQVIASPPSYAFLVTNLATAAITGIVIGRRGVTFPISGTVPNVPVRMASPPGWEGRHVHVEERPYLTYYWENLDASRRILPGQSAAGFRITLPAAAGDPTQVTFDRTPFEVAFADGTSWGGVVGLDRMSK